MSGRRPIVFPRARMPNKGCRTGPNPVRRRLSVGSISNIPWLCTGSNSRGENKFDES